ncbi:MAG: hypothetical protein NUW02_02080 [Candidatus Campbellbacteria bacterium]|nr:hypothetical protein [Candidatus Campbellbacteria bacterium]
MKKGRKAQVKTVRLVSGEHVRVDVSETAIKMASLMRIGKNLLVGSVKPEGLNGAYFWYECEDGVHRYLGDIVFSDVGNRNVLWKLFLVTGPPSDWKRLLRFFADENRVFINAAEEPPPPPVTVNPSAFRLLSVCK